MTRAVLILDNREDRNRAVNWVGKAPTGTRLEFRAPKRSLPQNNLMWSRLTDIAKQVDWHGQKLTPADWKDVFAASLRRARVVPNIDGDGFVQLGLHTSDMSKEDMGNLLDLIDAFGAERGITFKDSDSTDPAQSPPDDAAKSNAPAAEDAPVSSAGQQSEPSTERPAPAADEHGGEDAHPHGPSSPSLPAGTLILYASALRRAQKKDSLKKYAAQFWNERGGWDKWRSTTDGETAAAIFNAFDKHFGDKEAIERELRELI